MRAFVYLAAAVAIVLLSACKDGAAAMLPDSGGRPYETLIVANDKAAGLVVDSALSRDAAALPQPEPEFDTSLADSAGLNSMTRLARSIVVVTAGKAVFSKTRIRYDKDVWAKGQMVVYINTPDAARLKLDMAAMGSRLVSLLTRFEMNKAIKRLATCRNTRADSLVKAVSGRNICLPAAVASSKRGKDFVWLSDNANSGMTSFCAYTYGGLDMGRERFRHARDSVMKANIPGERNGMYMTTAPTELQCGAEQVRRRSTVITRGLWEMHGDAMGGPFVAHMTADTARRRIIVVEAFVYAPECKKRNLIRQAEAALYTLE